jgi:hypothetical protein
MIAPSLLCVAVAVHPVLSLYVTNPGQSPFPWALTATVAVAAGALAIIVGRVVRDRDKGALLVALAWVLACNYGPIVDAIRRTLGVPAIRRVLGTVRGVRAVIYDPDLAALQHGMFVAAFTVAFLLIAIAVVRTRRPLIRIREVSVAVALAALGLTAGQFVLSQLRAVSTAEVFPAAAVGPTATTATGRPTVTERAPSIYYIVLDGRASSRVLAQYFGYSDAEFVSALRRRGFYIADRSHANYPWTFLSLTSSLNMQYLDGLRTVLDTSTDVSLPYWMIANNKVGEFLKTRGYRFVNVSSGWGPTNEIASADENTNVGNPLAEFYDVFLHSTILRPVVSVGARAYASERIRRSLAGLRALRARARPTFVFAHVLAPHPPFVFGRLGEPRKPTTVGLRQPWAPPAAYVDQVAFIDRSVVEIVDHILANSLERPIIVIQSDHGPASTGSLDRPDPRMLRERMPIFNAYLGSDAIHEALYDTISPVNSFRVIFNETFGTDLPLHKDEAFFSTADVPYQWQPVSRELLP